ncbi:MAG: DNA polymerase/3'-5' exonuclease PolX [Deltaproteobacteria bacterium]|nr:DNA polymerase/3'-5' exonuclease PolX [Deltaproteobacteria bacterium]
MENPEIAQRLSGMADLIDLTGGSAFRARAYRRAAQLIELLSSRAEDLVREGKFAELPGIGSGIQGHVEQLLAHGSFDEYDALAAKVPPGVRELLQVEGVGPTTASAAWKKLQVTSVDALEEACRDGRLARVPRLGAKRVATIAEAIARYRARRGRTPLFRALGFAEELLRVLRQVPGVERAEAAGSLRRRKETVGDLDLLVATRNPQPVVRAFTHGRGVEHVQAAGPTRCTVRLAAGLSADLRIVEPDCFGAALHYFTGSKAHNIAVRMRAVRKGLKLSEYGIFDGRDRCIGGATEEEVYRAVGLPYIPPELREDTGELEAAAQGELPRLVELEDLRGDLHVHSNASSDGTSSVEELAAEARRLGREYLAITDHSRSRPLGLGPTQLARHAKRLRALDHELGGRPHLLAGIEVDIGPQGELDLPDAALAKLDLVVASVHAHFNDPREVMTARMIAAIRSGLVDVLGHPTGRQLGQRDPCALDLEAVLAAAREHGVALEANATPERMDLDDQGCRAAKRAGVPVVISSDAHHVSQLANLQFGVWMARRGWLERGDVLNASSWDALQGRLRRKPARSPGHVTHPP